MPQVSLDQVRGTFKPRDSWWTVLFVDPLAARLVRVLAPRAWITPTLLTVVAFVLGLGAAAAFLAARPAWWVAGAVAYYVAFALDCVDGKIARLRGQGSVLGTWLDFVLDRVRAFLCTSALFAGAYLQAGDDRFLFAAVGVVFLALIGYVNGAEVDKALRSAGAAPVASDRADRSGAPVLPTAVVRFRDALHRRRIRMNLVSGIEFETALFVVAPLAAAVAGTGAILVVTAVAAGLLVAFELALIARFVATAVALDRRRAQGRLPTPRATTSAHDTGRSAHAAGAGGSGPTRTPGGRGDETGVHPRQR